MDVLIASIFFHPCFELFVVQHLPTVLQYKGVSEMARKTNIDNHPVSFSKHNIQEQYLIVTNGKYFDLEWNYFFFFICTPNAVQQRREHAPQQQQTSQIFEC